MLEGVDTIVHPMSWSDATAEATNIMNVIMRSGWLPSSLTRLEKRSRRCWIDSWLRLGLRSWGGRWREGGATGKSQGWVCISWITPSFSSLLRLWQSTNVQRALREDICARLGISLAWSHRLYSICCGELPYRSCKLMRVRFNRMNTVWRIGT